MELVREEVPDGWMEERVAAALAAGIEIDHNEYGTPISVHHCETCGGRFTLCPPVSTKVGWENCMADECPSYDPSRDPTIYFRPDDPELIEDG